MVTGHGGGAALKLFAWLSPNFPVGGFAFSHGLEWAVDAGHISDAAGLLAWLSEMLASGAIRADAVLLAATWREPDRVAITNELALALASSSERRLETSAQGNAFLAAIAAAWPAPGLVRLQDAVAGTDIAYPVAIGAAAAAHGIPLRPSLETTAFATLSNLVSAAMRLGLVGQTQGQRIVADLADPVAAHAAWAETSSLDEDLGTCTWRADIAAMRHETQYSRLFRS